MPREPKAYLARHAQGGGADRGVHRGPGLRRLRRRRDGAGGGRAQFEIIGEALGQLAKLDPEAADRISEHRRIIAFRNILVHGYAGVDDLLVWDMIGTRLADLRRELEERLGAG
jgi:hypothetical protein